LTTMLFIYDSKYVGQLLGSTQCLVVILR